MHTFRQLCVGKKSRMYLWKPKFRICILPKEREKTPPPFLSVTDDLQFWFEFKTLLVSSETSVYLVLKDRIRNFNVSEEKSHTRSGQHVIWKLAMVLRGLKNARWKRYEMIYENFQNLTEINVALEIKTRFPNESSWLCVWRIWRVWN